MSAVLRPKNWAEFQHYKDRNPTWIKLHKKLLDDFTFQCLPLASKALAPMLWLLASESKDGAISYNEREIAFRLRVSHDDFCSAITPLISSGLFELEGNASNMLAEAGQIASPETERDTEKEEETDSVLRTALAKPPVLKPLDLDKAYWETGKAFLVANSVPPERAGGLLGKWRKQWGREAVVAALARAEAENPSEVVSFIEGTLRVGNGKQRYGPATGIVEGFAAALAERRGERI